MEENSDLNPEEDTGTQEEEKACEELAKALTNPQDSPELVDNAQEQFQNLLNRVRIEGKTPALEQKARALREGMAELTKMLRSQHQHRSNVYMDGDDSDYMAQRLMQNMAELDNLQKDAQQTEKALEELCDEFGLEKPDTTPAPLISQEALIQAFNTVLDSTVPGSELIKVILGTTERPETLQDYAKLAAETALDFLPGGKALKAFKGAAAKLGIKKLEKQLLKQAQKKAKQLKKAQKAIDVKFLDKKELARRLNVDLEKVHKAKRKILNEFSEALNKRGIKNPDICVDKAGNIVLRHPHTKETILTQVPLSTFAE